MSKRITTHAVAECTLWSDTGENLGPGEVIAMHNGDQVNLYLVGHQGTNYPFATIPEEKWESFLTALNNDLRA